MAKNKKKHKKKKKGGKKNLSTLKVLDAKMDRIHENLIEEIEAISREIKKKDKKIKKKAKKKARNGVLSVFNPMDEMTKVRMNAMKTIDRVNLLDVAESILKGFLPIVVVIARLIAALILLIFQCPLRAKLSASTVGKMDRVYKLAMAIG